MQIALVSLDQRWLDKDENFRRCVNFVDQAADSDCNLVVFPEMTLTGYSLDVAAIAESSDNSQALHRFGQLARDKDINIIFGACLIDPNTGEPHNTLCFARDDGAVFPVYDKIHPFSFAGEDKVLQMGDKLAVIEVTGFHVGCSICYDLRFPELFSSLAPSCDVMINIANWPATRSEHWRILLQARAIENQCFAIGVNRIGTDGNNLNYEKSSMVVAPNGSVLQPVLGKPEIDIYEVDSEEISRYRAEFPTIQDKRYSLYLDLLRKRCD